MTYTGTLIADLEAMTERVERFYDTTYQKIQQDWLALGSDRGKCQAEFSDHNQNAYWCDRPAEVSDLDTSLTFCRRCAEVNTEIYGSWKKPCSPDYAI